MRSTLLRRISTTASGSVTIRASSCCKSLLSLAPTLEWTVMVTDILDAERGFTLIFSGAPFPGHRYRLDWQREEGGGNWYYSADLDMEGWLCPALFKYFSDTPKTLYAQIKARS